MSPQIPASLLLATVLVVLGGCANTSRQPVRSTASDIRLVTHGEDGLLPGEQLQSLFSDITAYGVLAADGVAFMRYYGKDGRVIDLHPIRGRLQGRWRVEGEQLCIRWEGPDNCTRVARKDGLLSLQQQLANGVTRDAVQFEKLLRGNPEQLY